MSRYSEPSFSPNRQLIMFTEYDGNPMGAERLHTIRTNGTGRRQFAPGVGGTMSDGVWSPNGSKIAYVGGPVDQAPRLRTINANGAAGSVRTAASLAGAEDPDWSPNSKRLVFVHAPATVNTRIVDRVNADKSGLKKLADYGADRGAAEPVWSPDGTRIAFDKTRYSPAGNPEIWTMRVDGTGKTKVDGNGYGPTWQSR